MPNVEFLFACLEGLCGIPVEKLSLSTPIADLDLDSLRFTQMILDLERGLGIEFHDDDVEAILLARDVSDVAAAIGIGSSAD